MIKVTDQILFNLDGDEVTGLVVIDFKKAFDVVDHQLLLKKLKLYRVGDGALSWFKSYLSERSKFVALDGSLSERLEVKHGVPLFVNDLPLFLHNSSVDIFADDTTLSLNARYDDIAQLTDNLSSDLVCLNEWSKENKMFINTKKTKTMLVTGKRIVDKLENNASQGLELKINGVAINSVTSQKLIGVTLDSFMSYEPHVDELVKKISKRLGLLKHISPYLKQRQREMFYTNVIKPTLMYGSMIWDNCSNMSKQSVLKLQKRAARIILNIDRKTPSVTLFNTLNWLPFYKESLIKRNILVYKRVNDYNVPMYIRDLLVRNCDIHSRTTRYNNLNLVTHKHKRETEGGRTFVFTTAKQWNTLKVILRSQVSIGCFKRAIYKDLLDVQKATMVL